MSIRLHHDVYKQLQQLPRPIFVTVLNQILALVQDPRPTGCKKLLGAGGNDWRIRIGEYRIVYEFDDKTHTVTIMRVAHRREVYR